MSTIPLVYNAKNKLKMSYRRRRAFLASLKFPRWVVAASVLLIGFLLLLGDLSDASGRLRAPNLAALLYIVAIVGLALVIYSGLAPTEDTNGSLTSKIQVWRKLRRRPKAAIDSEPISRRTEASTTSPPTQQR